MGVLLTLIVALALWIVLWGVGLMKTFDAFIVCMMLVVLAASVHVVLPYLPGGKD